MRYHTDPRRPLGRILRRGAALLLSALCALGSIPFLMTDTARAASWMDPYLEQMAQWGVMRGDGAGNMNEGRQITRAEYVTMLNRAFGHKEMGSIPFVDVSPTAWYAEDIAIAYRAGYFTGTTATTASPTALVTREQAVAMLGRNMRIQEGAGATLDYTDSNAFANWSRGLIRECTEMGIISGYADGSFRPKTPITRGQAAVIIVRALGTLIQTGGEQSAGGVYGNLTVNTPGVTLKDSVITGNLYLSGGIGLDDVVLENVTVQGKIVVCGAGVSQKGESSILLRNVTAQGLEIDTMTGQALSLRAEGLTNIASVSARTDAFIEDLTEDGLGLRYIRLEGDEGAQWQLSGNIKEVINLTPGSALSFGQGVADQVTVDERATGSRLNVDLGAALRKLNLDTGTTVTGRGDVGELFVNAAGSQLPMLPESVTVRPGVTANVGSSQMDTTQALEYSEDPRILAGYPVSRNVAPKSADMVVSTNKAGTVYWALTALADGSVGEEALLEPAAYSAKILRSGSLRVANSRTEGTVKLTGLTVDGSYYFSAILVDSRGRRSGVKVAAFTTPDDTVPNFSTGYPYTVLTEEDDQQVLQAMVMATKSCQLYYALLPKGSTAPRAEDFKAAAVSGSLGYGVVEVKKNAQHLIPRINTAYLAEQTTYDLYLWLNDADNGKSSAVKRLSVTTADRTPPVIQHLTVRDMTAKAVTLTFSLDEPGTLYWAVVKRGAQFYAKGIDEAESRMAKIQVESGTGALKKGSVNAAKASTDVNFTVSGLEAQTSYDLYYVAKDKAGNYNVYTTALTPPMEITTLDTQAPTVKQEFTHDGSDSAAALTPYPDTSIRLVFSESVQGIRDVNGQQLTDDFLSLYRTAAAASGADRAAAEKALADALKAHISLYCRPASGQPYVVPDRTAQNAGTVGDEWVTDYRRATVMLDPSGSGEMIVTLPFHTNKDQSALNLGSGVTYYFELQGIADTSPAANRMQGTRGVTKLQDFTTIDAQLIFSRGTSTGTVNGQEVVFDMNFRLTPQTASSVSPEMKWDLLLWSTFNMRFSLYCREDGQDAWTKVGTGEFKTTTQTPQVGLSVARELCSTTPAQQQNPAFEVLRQATDREYGIVVEALNGSTVRSEWSGTVSVDIVPVAGDQGSMAVLANTNLTPENYTAHQTGIYQVKEMGVPTKYTVSCPFRDTAPPTFIDGYPIFTPGDSGANMDIQLSRNNAMYYYVVTEVGNIPTQMKDNTKIDAQSWDKLPIDGATVNGSTEGNVSLPTSDSITNPPYSGSKYIIGSGRYRGGVQTISLTTLAANTRYVAYFVLQGESQESISEVYAFRFQTQEVVRPVLRVSLSNPSATVTSVGENPKEAEVKYMMIVAGQEGDVLNSKMSAFWDDAAATAAGLDAAKAEEYKKMTLLEAMETSYTQGRHSLGSVFDLFANASKQSEVSAWFNSASSNGTSIMLTGNMSLTVRNQLSQSVNCRSAMNANNPNMEYWFVAMGQSPLGSGYAFSAGRYLFYPDNTPPQVITLSTEVKTGTGTGETELTNDYQKALNQRYFGTVTLTFSTDLYYKQNSTTYLQVVDKPIADLVTETGCTSTASLVNTTNSVSIQHLAQGQAGTPPCRTLILEFKGISSGNQISFSQNLSNSRGITGSTPLTLVMSLVKDKEGFYVPQFNLASDGWGTPVVK